MDAIFAHECSFCKVLTFLFVLQEYILLRLYMSSCSIISWCEVMVPYSFTAILLVLVMCSFCGRHFKSLGRQIWHCREKIKRNKDREQHDATGNMDIVMSPQSLFSPSTNSSTINCSCRKVCNGLKGLKMHQHSCQVIKGLADETCEIHCNIGGIA